MKANTIDVVEIMARSIWDGDGLLDSDEARDIAAGCLEALREEGYVVVPAWPTDEMVERGYAQTTIDWCDGRSEVLDVWFAMIAAATR